MVGFKIRVKAFYSLEFSKLINYGHKCPPWIKFFIKYRFKLVEPLGSENRPKLFCRFSRYQDFINRGSPKKVFLLQNIISRHDDNRDTNSVSDRGLSNYHS